MYYEEALELAAVICGLDESAEEDQIQEAVLNEFNTDVESFHQISRKLLEIVSVGSSPITAQPYVGFANDRNQTWIVKKECNNQFIPAVINWIADGHDMEKSNIGHEKTIAVDGESKYDIQIRHHGMFETPSFNDFDEIRGTPEIDNLFWIAGSIESYELHDLLGELSEVDWIRLVGEEVGSAIFKQYYESNLWPDVIHDNELYGFIAEIHIPECRNFSFDKDGNPTSWSVHRGISRPRVVYGKSIDRLMYQIKSVSQEVFDEYIKEDKARS